MRLMGPIAHIRRNIFRMTQAAFGALAGVTQATVSRWEAGESEPNRDEMERIRTEALQRGIQWDDRWFFRAPDLIEAESMEAPA